MSKPLRIGMLTPSSNTVLEPMTYRLLEGVPDVSVHISRIPVTAISLETEASDQFGAEPMIAAAEQLRDAAVDVVVWNGTAGSWLGPDGDRKLCDRLSTTTGVPATTSTLALLEAFRAFGVRRLGLVTPYTGDVTGRIAECYAGEGVEVVAERHLDITDNHAFCDVDEQRIRELIEAAATNAQAVAVVCTNLRGAFVAPEREPVLGIPVFDSVAATLWQSMRLGGVEPELAGRGSLLLAGSVRSRLQEICAELRTTVGADRTTIRLDLPSRDLGVDLPAAEAAEPGVRSLLHESGLDQRALETVRWLDAQRRTLVQPHFRHDPQPPEALVETYGVRAQILTPVERDRAMVGWLSVHSTAERDWTGREVTAIETAAFRVHDILDGSGLG